MSSLSARLLLSVSLLLLIFFGATIVVLDSAFREAGEQAQQDILDGQLMGLIAAAEPNIYGELEMRPNLPEPRFDNIDSGLYGQLRDDTDTPVWKSNSALGLHLPFGPPPAAGNHHFERLTLSDGTPLMVLSLSVDWELSNGEFRQYTFSVAESLDSFNAQLARFRRQLFGWFAAVSLVMLFAISIAMRVILRPLRQVEQEISDVEEGRRQELSDDFPTELTGVARNMNLLIGSERGRSERYRKTLDNLAHSLKTPLAAIRSLLSEQESSALGSSIETQVERMNDIVRYQLRKPATLAGDSVGISSVNIENELLRLVEGLMKVYKDKGPSIAIDVCEGARFRGDAGDFLELAGNLLDNACKWCHKNVQVRVSPLEGKSAASGNIRMSVSDDGPGIPDEAADLLLKRGMRLDESAPGHGIGLAVVKDIAASFGGELTIEKSSLGGAEVTVTIAPGLNKHA